MQHPPSQNLFPYSGPHLPSLDASLPVRFRQFFVNLARLVCLENQSLDGRVRIWLAPQMLVGVAPDPPVHAPGHGALPAGSRLVRAVQPGDARAQLEKGRFSAPSGVRQVMVAVRGD